MRRGSLLGRGIAVLAVACAASAARADDSALNLPIGDPARKDRTAPLVLDAATDTATGEVLTPRELAARLAGVRLLFVGESHTSEEFHAVQLATLRALRASGREVLIGLEMYPSTEQAALDQWNAGSLDETAFVQSSRWYKNWGYHWNYYREIFLLAKANGIRMVAVNAPRPVISAVGRKGLEGLTPEEAALLPPRIDTDSDEHKRLFRAFFGDEDALHGGMTDEQFTRMFRAQCAWDAAMGANAAKALEQHGGKDAIMVVLIGSGHVAYGLGAERQARLWFDGKMASLIPIPVENEKRERPTVRASYASFLWGVAREEHPAYPSLGLSTPERKDGEHFKVIMVQKGSPAERAGVEVGDHVVSIDGKPYDDKETFNTVMSEKRWGGTVELALKRGEETLTLKVLLRRTLKETEAEPAEAAK